LNHQLEPKIHARFQAYPRLPQNSHGGRSKSWES
jgi:hypothetical protein